MARRFAWALGVILPLAVGLYAIPQGDLALLVAGSVGLALVVAAATARPVQQRLGLVRTPAVKIRRVYDRLNEIRDPLVARRYARGPELTRAEWQPKVVEWDRQFWALVDDVFFVQGAALRSRSYDLADLTNRKEMTDNSWTRLALRFLDQRKERLDELMRDIPPG